MSIVNNGGPAFPTENEHQSGNSTWHYEGMTLRDYFAAKAMQGFFAESSTMSIKDIAEWSYKMADAMLKERDKS